MTPGLIIGSYEILRQLGQGGMGTVYLARHMLLGRLAAIKILLPELSLQAEMVARIFNEARIMATIHHPGLVGVYDFGRDASGCAYLVMEYLQGETLADLLEREGRLPLDQALALGRQITSAVAVAHAQGIVHRDLKPENVFLVADEETSIGLRARLLDFGIAKLAAEGGAIRTRTGSLVGTPAYMSPEQCRGAGGAIDGRSDIYALGCMLFEMLCGRRVFPYQGMGELIAAQLYELPVAPSVLAPDLPGWLEALVVSSLAKDPAHRPQSMDEVHQRLAGPSGEPGRARRTPPPRPRSGGGVPRVPTTASRLVGEAVASAPHGASRVWTFAATGLALALAGALAGVLSVDRSPAVPAAPPPPATAPTPDAAPPPPAVADAGPVAVPEPDAAPPPVRRIDRPRQKPPAHRTPDIKEGALDPYAP